MIAEPDLQITSGTELAVTVDGKTFTAAVTELVQP